MDVTQLIDAYCAVWNEPDPAARARLLATVWAPEGRYTDPSVHAEGADALLAHIAAVRAQRPGARWVRTSEVNLHHDVARFNWQATRGEEILRAGLDVAILGKDGTRIERMIGFFGLLADA